MIRRLRWKMTGIMMAIVAILLCAVFLTLYGSTRASYRHRSLEALRAAVRRAGVTDKEPPPPAKHPGPGPHEELPILLLEEQADGTILVLDNRLYSSEELDAEDLAALIRDSDSPFGVLKSEHLLYLREAFGPDRTIRYAVTDTYAQEHALKRQVIHSVFIGSGALIIFFFFSLLLSRWAVRPVETTWEQQQQFISDASHELKTPLTVILANAELMIQSEAPSGTLPFRQDAEKWPGDNRQRIRHIQAEAIRMKELVESLLTLARNDSGRDYHPHQTLDFSYVVNTSLARFEPLAFETGREISGEIEDGILLKGDEKKLRQLADILLDNACKYSRAGSRILVSLSCGPKHREREAVFSVTSEGEPLSEDEASRIFLRFYRADPSRSLVHGYGLGLSIAQGIVKEHRGSIQAKSDGKGKNCFLVTLPL